LITLINYATYIKTLEIKLALWLAPLLSPKEMLVSNLIVVKVMTLNGGKGAKARFQGPI
jgi:hypothetical protein